MPDEPTTGTDQPDQPLPPVRKVFLACPCGDGRLEMKTAMAILNAGLTVSCRVHASARSALANNFNSQWCECLNAVKAGEPFTHFVMLHSDVYPVNGGWLTLFLNEMDRVRADVLSAVIPIKDHCGVTSTAVHLGGGADGWGRRRLTMTEIMELPVTFDRHVIHAKMDLNGTLLVNTGLLAIDLRSAWPMRKIAFTQRDRVLEVEGKLYAAFEPEDWDFSKQAERLGASVHATRCVVVHHIGKWEYPNVSAWGTCVRDPGVCKDAYRPDSEIVVPLD